MDALLAIIALLQGYLLGSLNASLLIGKIYGVDVRKMGSGNAGMTNTLRSVGKFAAILVTIGDMLKAVVACMIGGFILKDAWGFSEVGLMFGGFGAILGHNWPVFFGFRGGKGVLTTFAFILMMNLWLGLILFGIFLFLVVIFRYVSLGSLVACLAFPLLSYLFKESFHLDFLFILFATLVSILVVMKHRSNIKRLLQGNENRIGKTA